MEILDIDSKLYHDYYTGYDTIREFWGIRDASMGPKIKNSRCQVYRVAYFWPTMIYFWRSFFLCAALAVPLWLMYNRPIEMLAGVVAVAIIVGEFALAVMALRWVLGKYLAWKANRTSSEDSAPNHLLIWLSSGYRWLCPQVEFRSAEVPNEEGT